MLEEVAKYEAWGITKDEVCWTSPMLLMLCFIKGCFDGHPECSADTLLTTSHCPQIARRLDLREARIFSIDPTTARDLDDALSIQPLPNGMFRVGVHIADVAHFVAP